VAKRNGETVVVKGSVLARNLKSQFKRLLPTERVEMSEVLR